MFRRRNTSAVAMPSDEIVIDRQDIPALNQPDLSTTIKGAQSTTAEIAGETQEIPTANQTRISATDGTIITPHDSPIDPQGSFYAPPSSVAATKGSSTSKYPTVDTVETLEKTIQPYLQCPAMLYPEVCVVPDFKAIEAHHPSKIWIGITVKGKLQLPPGLSEEIYGKLSAGPQRHAEHIYNVEIQLSFHEDVCKLHIIEGSDFGLKLANFDTSTPSILAGDLYNGQGTTFLALVEFPPIHANKDATYNTFHDNHLVDLGIYRTNYLKVTARWSHNLFPAAPGQPQVTMNSTNNISIKRYQPFSRLDPDHEPRPPHQLVDHLWDLWKEGRFSFVHFEYAALLMSQCLDDIRRPYLLADPGQQSYRCEIITLITDRLTKDEALAVDDSGPESDCAEATMPEHQEGSEKEEIDEQLREGSDAGSDYGSVNAAGDRADDYWGYSPSDHGTDQMEPESGSEDSYDNIGNAKAQSDSGRSEDSYDYCDDEIEQPANARRAGLFPILRPMQLPYSLRRNNGFTDLAGRARMEPEWEHTSELEDDYVD